MSDHGHNLYSLFDTIVILDKVMRQAGDNPDALSFRSLLMRMRDGRVTEQDWHLLQQSPGSVHMVEFADTIRLFYDKKSVAYYNYEKLRANGQPVAKIQARHPGHGASAATSYEAGGLELVLILSKKADVMLTSNLWAEAGLWSGKRVLVC